MKRFIIILGILTLTTTAFAQKKGYDGSVYASYRGSINSDENALAIETIHGYRFNPFIFVGGGAGIEIANYGDLCRVGTPKNYKEVKNMTVPIIPVFVAFKANFTKTRFTPFFMIKSGATFGSSDTDKAITNSYFVEPALGFDVYLGDKRKNAITAIFGLNMRKNTNILTWDLAQPSFINSIRIGVGFKF